MRTTTCLMAFILLVLASVSGLTFAQEIDLSGTWVGETEVPDAIEPDELTLVMNKEDGEYTGKITDSMGMLDNTELEDIEFVDGKLTFNIEVNNGEEYVRVYLTLTVEGNTMTGYWESEDGNTGPVKMQKK